MARYDYSTNRKMKLRVANIQRFCMHDGNGLRTTIFLKGCPLNCKWCHNPETKSFKKQLLFYSTKCIQCQKCKTICNYNVHQFNDKHCVDFLACKQCGLCELNCPTSALEICGKELSIYEILNIALKDKAFYGENGGITLSGGEPFFQPYPTIDLLKACKDKGLNTAVETCGFFDRNIIFDCIPYVDLFLYDIKDTDSKRHNEYCGVPNHKIIDNLKLIDSLGGKTRLRCILVNSVNTNSVHYENIAKLVLSLKNCEGVEFIPYHAYSGSKNTFLGFEDNGHIIWIPTIDQINTAKKIMAKYNIRTF